MKNTQVFPLINSTLSNHFQSVAWVWAKVFDLKSIWVGIGPRLEQLESYLNLI